MPGEPPHSNFKQKVRQLAYPVREIGGLIFAYMGPPELEPPFPRYHQLFSTDGVRVTGNGGYIERCNVFQALHDNNMDPWHGEIAHGWFRNPPKTGTMYWQEDGTLSARYWCEAAREKKDPPGVFYYWRGERPRHPNAPQLEGTGEITIESADRAAGYWTTRSDADPQVRARTSGVYVRAHPDDLSILNGRDDQKRAALIAERLTDWKTRTNA